MYDFFMKHTILILVTFLLLQQTVSGQSHYPVTLTGFNADVIYDTGETLSSTADVDGGSWAFYSKGIKEDGGIPQSFTSSIGVPYKLAAFTAKNALLLGDKGQTSGELIFASPLKTSQLWITGTASNGSKTFQVVVNYTDGTFSSSMDQTFQDWFQDNGQKMALYGISRIKISNSEFDVRLQFGLFEGAVPTNPAKDIKSVTITNTGGSYAIIFGISAYDTTKPKITVGNLDFISNAHMDTQWNWTVKNTIDEYIPNTLNQNFALFEAYPSYHFNFEGAIKYMWMKEYYPTEFTKLKEYIAKGNWHVSGGSVDANDVMVPSAESIIRNFLYGQKFYQKEFGVKGGSDIMLPDCFGFPATLPTLGKHCGVTGFHSQKLSWGSAYNYDELPPFGRWKGVDGSEIYVILKPGSYTNQDAFYKDMSYDSEMMSEVNANKNTYGMAATYKYVGTGDRGGGVNTETAKWLDKSMSSAGPVNVRMVSPDLAFAEMDQYKESLPIIDHELPMRTHGTGCYTSQAIRKYWNRKNELLADATEKSSFAADWLGGLKYQQETINKSWIRLLWHQFHDDITGTSIPEAYGFSYNDDILTQLDLSKTMNDAVGSISRNLSTNTVAGIPVVVYNPLSIERSDVVESSIVAATEPTALSIMDKDGKSVPVQITEYLDGKVSFIFLATVPSLGYATYDVRVNETSTPEASGMLNITTTTIENDAYLVTVNAKGDVSSILDKRQSNKELLNAPVRLAMLYDESKDWPSWEIPYDVITGTPREYVDENVEVSIAENGPLRSALKIKRTKAGSEFIQFIRLTSLGSVDRIDFTNEVNWQTQERLLKAVFPLNASNVKATYDASIGAVQRSNNTSDLYEVAGHQWADLTNSDNVYGISILNDCKYGWDKPANNTLRLSLIHTPKPGNFDYEGRQDLGLNKFTYSFYRHMGQWNEDTQWEASKLNQPLLAYQATKHEGALGKSFEFAKLSSDKVAIKALKKAESSDDMIVRVYELTGNAQDNVEIEFPANIVSAKEVNGVEEEVGVASFSGNKLTLSLTKFQPKTFAVKLAAPAATIAAPVSNAVTLTYNADVMSNDADKKDGQFATSGSVYPAELIADQVISEGIAFTMGSRANDAMNAVRCQGQTVTLPQGNNATKLYLLAASLNTAGSAVNFTVDGVATPVKVEYFADYVGQWGTVYASRFYKAENAALTLTHRHDYKNNTNLSYQYLYMFKYVITVPANVTTLTLPNDNNVFVFAATMSDNKNDDIVPLSEIRSLPEPKYTTIIDDETCGYQLTPDAYSASGFTKTSEAPGMVGDNNPFTKWCDDKSAIKWVQLTFNEEMEVCQWNILNAGIEGDENISSAYTLQYMNASGLWVNADVVTNNTAMKTSRVVAAVRAKKFRLLVVKGQQTGNTARIFSFDLYGRKASESGVEKIQLTNATASNYPNPFSSSTTIDCTVPDNTTHLTLMVYSATGSIMDVQEYPLIAGGKQNITWKNKSLADGIYFYTILANSSEKDLKRIHGKMIIATGKR